jgi:hypothetical protein
MSLALVNGQCEFVRDYIKPRYVLGTRCMHYYQDCSLNLLNSAIHAVGEVEVERCFGVFSMGRLRGSAGWWRGCHVP